MAEPRTPGVQDRAISDEMRACFIDYSMSVIVDRALPDVRDGLKPVHRRILYAMHEAGLTPARPYRKSATVVGDVLGKYHPHGDSAVYDAMVRMAQPFSLNHPLVDGQGNFGSIDGDNAAAYRYTEARLDALAMELLSDIDRETVDFRPTFDDSGEEPTVLPARLPNLLLNGSEGIAVGMATKVPPHNLREIGAAVALLCERPDAADAEVLACVKGPDFPTGGLVLDGPGIADFYRKGRGSMTMRARATIERLRGGKAQVVFTDIPYGVYKSKIIEDIAALANSARQKKGAEWAEAILDLRDESDRRGIRIVVEVRKGHDPVVLLERLYRHSDLQRNYGGILLALVGGTPRQIGLRTAVECFIDHRLEVIVRRARFDLAAAEHRLHILEGLLVAVDGIEEVVQIIKGSQKRETAARKLRERFGFSDVQVQAILNLRLSQLTSLEVGDLKGELADKRRLIKELQALLASPAAQRKRVRDECEEAVARFGRPRRTAIVSSGEAERLIQDAADERMVVGIDASGRARSVPLASAAADDGLVARTIVNPTERVVLFTESGKAYSLFANTLPEESRPIALAEVVRDFDRKDRVLLAAAPAQLAGSVLSVSARGLAKRTAGDLYAAPKAGGIQSAGLADGDRLVATMALTGEEELLLVTERGKCIRFRAEEVPIQGRTAVGVVGMKVEDGDRVVAAVVCGAAVTAAAGNGRSRRVEIESIPLQRRGGKGVWLVREAERWGGLSGVASHADSA
jgi:DNA gyrase subunit A